MMFILATIGFVLSVFVSYMCGIAVGMKNGLEDLKKDGWTIKPPEKHRGDTH